MKKFVAFALMTSTLTAMAAERNIYDLMYLPKSGTVYGMSDLSLATGAGEGKTEVEGSGTEKYDIELSGYSVDQVIGYSFTDRLSIQTSLSYTSLRSKIDFDNPLISASQSETTAKGLNDPNLNLRYRALEDVLILDIIAGYTAKSGSSTTENNKQGGNSSRLGFQIGQKFNSIQWAFFGGYERYYKATQRSDDGKTIDDTHDEWTFGGNALFKLAETSFIRAESGFQVTDRYEDNTNESTATKTFFTTRGEYQHLISADLLLRAGLQFGGVSQGKIDYGIVVANVGASYQF